MLRTEALLLQKRQTAHSKQSFQPVHIWLSVGDHRIQHESFLLHDRDSDAAATILFVFDKRCVTGNSIVLLYRHTSLFTKLLRRSHKTVFRVSKKKLFIVDWFTRFPEMIIVVLVKQAECSNVPMFKSTNIKYQLCEWKYGCMPCTCSYHVITVITLSGFLSVTFDGTTPLQHYQKQVLCSLILDTCALLQCDPPTADI